MSKEFIERKANAQHIEVARRQQRQLSYFTQSEIQKEFGIDYWKMWANRKYYSDDYFANFIKEILRTDNFIAVYKHMRKPLPSAKLVNDEIRPQLKRVYYADDSYFKYTIKSKKVDTPEELKNDSFETELFNAALFNYNDVIVHDLSEINTPYRHIVSIDKIVSIESECGKIKRLAYCATIDREGDIDADKEALGSYAAPYDSNKIHGYLYIDDKRYTFYDETLTIVPGYDIPHDLGECPACWISNEAFDTKTDIVRKSLFSYVRPELEEYVFLHALWRMAEVAGAIPATIKLKTTNISESAVKSTDGLQGEPSAHDAMSSQSPTFGADVPEQNGSPIEVGSVTVLPVIIKDDGSIDTDLVQNFMKFVHFPVETLEYMRDRISNIERSIISNSLGDYSQNNDAAKNETQVVRANDNRQDKLRSLSMMLSWCRNQTDYILLSLKYGKGSVLVSLFYGSDFFLDNEAELYDLFKVAPNQIERRNLLNRIAKTKYRFNRGRMQRELLLYSLLPFICDSDFNNACTQQLVDDKTKKLYLQFDYWLFQFEAEYGDIVEFYNGVNGNDSKKWVTTNSLLMATIPEVKIVPLEADKIA